MPKLSVLALFLLAGCGYPVRTPPFLNGAIGGVYCPEPYEGEACAYVGAPLTEGTLLAQLDVRVDTWSSAGYAFSGTLELDGTRYAVRGEETGAITEQHQYLAPQAHLLGGFVTATLTGEDGAVYRLEGFSRYGSGGGLSPVRESPSANLSIYTQEAETCDEPTLCILGELRFPVD